MTSLNSEQLLQSLQTGFISKTYHSVNELAPTLLVNDYHKEKKILSSLVEELTTCEAFDFSVAFINNEGLAAIKQTLDEIAQYSAKHPDKAIKGRILTTNYLNFTQPSALKELMQFPNIEIRAYTKGGFHPKGYIFKQSNYYSMIIGSANLTSSALTMNQEWSVKFLSCTDGQIVYTVREEFERVWTEADVVNEEWLEKYSDKYEEKKLTLKLVNKQIKELRKQSGESLPMARTSLLTTPSSGDTPQRPDLFFADVTETQFEQFTESPADYDDDEVIEIVPNAMQKEAMAALHNLREEQQNRALLIAATGTGKTYLSIFDVNQVKPKKVLYVAHRDMILDKSEKSFKNILPDIKTGFLICSLQFFSIEFARGIRLHELLLISLLIKNEKISLNQFTYELEKYNVKLTKNDFKGMLNLLSPDFYTQNDKKKYSEIKYVTYENNEIIRTTKYEDVFIDNTRFSWMSRSRRNSKSDEVAALIAQPNNNIKIMLFVKKNDGEGSDFYYMGKMKYNSFEDTTMKDKDGSDVSVVNIQFDMETPVPHNLYNYLEA